MRIKTYNVTVREHCVRDVVIEVEADSHDDATEFIYNLIARDRIEATGLYIVDEGDYEVDVAEVISTELA